MRKIEKLIAEYGESHQNKTNKLIHWLCVPSIFFSIVALVWCIPLGPLENLTIDNIQVYQLGYYLNCICVNLLPDLIA